MDRTERENWERIKDKMEESGTTDNFFYKRACAILAGNADPLENLKVKDKEDE